MATPSKFKRKVTVLGFDELQCRCQARKYYDTIM